MAWIFFEHLNMSLLNQSTARDDSIEWLLNQFLPLSRPWLTVNRSRQLARTDAVRPRRKSNAERAAALKGCLCRFLGPIGFWKEQVRSKQTAARTSAQFGHFENIYRRSRSKVTVWSKGIP